MEFLNEQIIRTGFFITIILIIIPFGKSRLKRKSLLVANTKYVKQLPRYKVLNFIYIFSILIVILAFFASMMVSFFLNARLVEVNEEIHEEYNRDIFLCMDVSGSMYRLNKEIVVNFKNIVKKLDGDRVGIVIFDNSSVVLSPLTDDYDFVLDVLDKIEEACDGYFSGSSSYLLAGTRSGTGSSLVGDGLTTCVNVFANTDKSAEGLMTEDRTRIIILSTDNMAGRGLFTLDEAVNYAKSENIVVHGITPLSSGISYYGNVTETFRAAVNKTGGKLYFGNQQSVSNIINDIDKTNKSLLKTEKEIIKVEIPEYSFSYLLIAFGIYVVFSRKIRL